MSLKDPGLNHDSSLALGESIVPLNYQTCFLSQVRIVDLLWRLETMGTTCSVNAWHTAAPNTQKKGLRKYLICLSVTVYCGGTNPSRWWRLRSLNPLQSISRHQDPQVAAIFDEARGKYKAENLTSKMLFWNPCKKVLGKFVNKEMQGLFSCVPFEMKMKLNFTYPPNVKLIFGGCLDNSKATAFYNTLEKTFRSLLLWVRSSNSK